ncbi:ATP-dependent helicase [Agitococcus lubricus]|uniref:DNA 3'-5' helicase n=1 Tax=Agitococcus lubricus TaxID=1077255 RepID=A0A2T5IWD6_9GAMM|nr:ATP-dependent helicase [Agitococcus lubricus]PTQ88250.1 DNA helicase-2/ATP-dependent DNA helicase PcrA [Agitococcus lubricus]
MLQLTEEQQAIVQHQHGAAVVYAVAGAGKSTTMAHRVAALVNKHGVLAQRILVCSFSRETVSDIRRKIEGLGVQGAQCLTFNALGRRIIQQTVQLGYWLSFDEQAIEQRSHQLAMRALVELSRRHGKNFANLDINQDDLLTFISICKGNLRYANLLQAQLPPPILSQVEQAHHQNPHYLQAYQVYEQLRQQQHCLTFDDQLLLAWEALVRFDEVRVWAKQQFDYVLIDEFQDVNKVQVEIADILTEDHRNYMAIGDDDQCIYEWRGANVRYILDFKRRYQAQEYIISDNFRCYAQTTLLAGQVIQQNKQRYPKNLVAQKGFGGQLVLKGFEQEYALANYIVNEYKQLLAQGLSPQEVVILVRSYAQTAVIEAKLIQEGLPYHVVGSARFYERPEVKTLLSYLGLARQERDLSQHIGSVSSQYIRRCLDTLKAPNRYLSQEWLNQFANYLTQQSQSALAVLANQQVAAPNEAAHKRLQQWVAVMRYLQQSLHKPIAEVLQTLISELGYLEYLKKAAGMVELGEERCQNVRALVNYAQKQGTVVEFLAHLAQLYKDTQHTDDSQPRLQMMSIHRAKGLEWPTVFVPCCADEQLPINQDNLEEERRLLYVAMTRSQKNLHLLYSPTKKMSLFLREIQAEQVLQNASKLQQSLQRIESALEPDDAINLALGLKMYPLKRYLVHWWQPYPALKRAYQQQATRALARQSTAIAELSVLKQQQQSHEQHHAQQAEQQRLLHSLSRRLQLFRTRPVTVILDTSAPEQGFGQQRFRFQTTTEQQIAVYLATQRVGIVDINASRFPLNEIHEWSWVAGHVSVGFRFSYLRRQLNLTLELAVNAQQLAQKAHPKPTLSAMNHYFASPEFNADIQQLIAVLSVE